MRTQLSVVFGSLHSRVVHGMNHIIGLCSDEMLKMGIDEVYCLSVNDAFVMRQVRMNGI